MADLLHVNISNVLTLAIHIPSTGAGVPRCPVPGLWLLDQRCIGRGLFWLETGGFLVAVRQGLKVEFFNAVHLNKVKVELTVKRM